MMSIRINKVNIHKKTLTSVTLLDDYGLGKNPIPKFNLRIRSKTNKGALESLGFIPLIVFYTRSS